MFAGTLLSNWTVLDFDFETLLVNTAGRESREGVKEVQRGRGNASCLLANSTWLLHAPIIRIRYMSLLENEHVHIEKYNTVLCYNELHNVSNAMQCNAMQCNAMQCNARKVK